MMYPKPTKKEHTSAKRDEKSDLVTYRHVQVALAIARDNNQCVFCYFLEDGKLYRREEVHHVYSRGKKAGDWREHYSNLLCTCKRHHPMPIQTPGGNHSLSWVEEVREKANATPINSNFGK